MLSAEQLEACRRMTPAERFRITLSLMDFALSELCRVSPEERVRRLAIAAGLK